MAQPQTKISLDAVKVFYDQQGQAREVLMSYDLFQQIESLLSEVEQNEAYFWTAEWQARIQEAEDDIRKGRVKRVTADSINKALEWLDE